MKCKECNGIEFEYNDWLLEQSCVQCGYVMFTKPFEETVHVKVGEGDNFGSDKGTLGSLIGKDGVESKHLRRAIRTTRSRVQSTIYSKGNERETLFYATLRVLLSSYATSDTNSINVIKEDILSYFRTLDSKHQLRGYTNDERAAALSYIVFREHGWPVTLHSISKHSDVSRSRVSKVARKLAGRLGKSSVLSQVPFVSWCEREANIMGGEEYGLSAINLAPVMQDFFLKYGFPLTRVQVATTLYMCSLLCGYKYTQRNIGKQLKTYPISMRQSLERICKQMGIKRDDLLMMSLDDFINGAF